MTDFQNKQEHDIQMTIQNKRQKVYIDGYYFIKRSSNKLGTYWICNERKQTGWI